MCCFNPRPLLLTGESCTARVPTKFNEPFQSTPVIADGRIDYPAFAVGLRHSFQSTPVIANGRIAVVMLVPIVTTCFNPRPLLLTGESMSDTQTMFLTRTVSIHARYC